MWWWDVAIGVTLGTNVVMLAANALKVRRSRALLAKCLATDELLSRLCLQAYMTQHTPIWHAWAQSMGNYRVEITASAQRDRMTD
jgi:hypothetical protein